MKRMLFMSAAILQLSLATLSHGQAIPILGKGEQAFSKPRTTISSALAVKMRGWDQLKRDPIQADILLREENEEFLKDLEYSGVSLLSRSRTLTRVMVQGGPEELNRASKNPGVLFMDVPEYPVPQGVGTVETEGELVIRGNVARERELSGAGVSVGVISTGLRFLQDSQMKGDLPTTVTARSFRSDGILDVDGEGTALLEIIHDLAPGANLFFANIGSSLQFEEAIEWLAERCDIICSNLIFLRSGPYDGSSFVSQAATATTEEGKFFFQAVGNYARDHFQGEYEDLNMDGFHDFANESIRFLLRRGERVQIVLQWNDPWQESSNDYDLYLFDYSTLSVAGESENWQRPGGGVPPVEFIDFTNHTGQDLNMGILVANHDRKAEKRTIEIFLSEVNGRRYGLLESEYVVSQSSIGNLADAFGVFSIGAVPFQVPDILENFSSMGPTNDGRLKPEMVGPNGVSTSVIGFTPFTGTSAAAPHGAGAAALLLEYARQIAEGTEQAVILTKEAFLSGAADLGEPGPDYSFGYGRMDVPGSGAVMAMSPDVRSGNINRDGEVGPEDLLSLLRTWRQELNRSEDVDWSGAVDLPDLLILQNQWKK